GRDGMGGATGSSKSHTVSSLTQCGAEVQKGNAPEERKLQRLFRNPAASKLIKRCNDFGAGGVSVAIGELADGLKINLNAVPKKYEGLDGTEIAIAESQERMAVVLAPEDVDAFRALADEENLESTAVAVVTESPRMVMEWNGATIVDMSREFLNSNGAAKYADAFVEKQEAYVSEKSCKGFAERIEDMAQDLNFCSRRGLTERFDSTNGACSLLMPYGGKYQKTPSQAMASLVPLPDKNADTASVMAYGFHPCISEKSPYRGAYLAVVESMARIVATGAGWRGAHLTFQEYFERMTGEAYKWGRPLSALLGALEAQLDLDAAAIGGKDSMSGSFEKMHVPPTLVSFAVQVCDAKAVISNEFKATGHAIGLIAPEKKANGLPVVESLRAAFDKVTELIAAGKAVSVWALGFGGVAEAIMKMSMGNRIGAEITADMDLFAPAFGSFLIEYADAECENKIGCTTADYALTACGEKADMTAIEAKYEGKLNGVFPATVNREYKAPRTFSFEAAEKKTSGLHIAQPKVLIPVFPGTNCEFDTLKAFEKAGAKADVMVVRNLSAKDVAESAEEFARRIADSQIIFIPGGFSGGDEPDGSGKFITAFFRNAVVADEVNKLLSQRDGLI
ncbi:MAG: phosphoribosylformylglycinamidine synthase subunit PurQ, partial [Clostridia bacterium]|nr:phosphoribosylformylglycinamidine synthase subunit PurQ [Clostridia bacterium]